jgi:hypothetical protein
VLSLLYRADTSADPTAAAAEELSAGADPTPSNAREQRPSAEVMTKRALAERAYAELSADGMPPSSAELATAAGLSPSYARALVAEFQARAPALIQAIATPAPS